MRKHVLVSVDRGETRVAMLEATGEPAPSGDARRRRGGRGNGNPGGPKKSEGADGLRTAEVYFERRGGRSIVGNIYKGKVDNVLPGLEAAFVDIGLEKNGFLHVDEIVIPGEEQIKRGRSNASGKTISDLIKPGQEIVVQVVKDPLKTKGARLSMDLTIAGRYMVYAPTGEGIGVSRRLEESERNRLRKEAKKLELPKGGAIIRTAAHGGMREDFERELLYLYKLNEVLEERVAKTSAPAMVFQEADLSVRVVRDIFSEDFEKAVVDDQQQYNRLVSFFSRTAPELVERVELWEEDEPLFEANGVEEVIEGMLSRRVDLPSGGYLIIDYAEALTVIDVNSGSFIGRGKQARLEDTITRTNLEAADEVVNQLRLRDIGGIIVIDFIDMARARNRDAVLKTLRKALDEDRTKTFVVEISPLGLVEMTRQNVTDGVREIMTCTCPTCQGEGVIRSEETIAIDVERWLREVVKEAGEQGPEAYLIRLHPRVTAQFTGDGARVLHELEAETGRFFHFEGSEGLPLDHSAIVMEGTRAEVAERAIPFRDGDEVHVEIVEPHMYNVDDAVAKIDGYVISVEGGGRFVGSKRLVRITQAGRTAAAAELIDLTDEERAELDTSAAKSARPSRSRGRRGGRGRKKGEGTGSAEDAGQDTDAGSADPDDALMAEAAEHAASASEDAREHGESTDGTMPSSRNRASAAGRAGAAERAEETATGTHDPGDMPGDVPPGRSAGESLKAEAVVETVADRPADDDAEGASEGESASEDEDALDSKPRRRGRRGGRRRSRAKASDAADADDVSEASE